jgi:hypothetical protein
MEGANCGLHPLIHTFPSKSSTQNLEKRKAEPRTPHILSLNQDIVAWPQEQECGLKYVMFTQSKKATELFGPSVAAIGYTILAGSATFLQLKIDGYQ